MDSAIFPAHQASSVSVLQHDYFATDQSSFENGQANTNFIGNHGRSSDEEKVQTSGDGVNTRVVRDDEDSAVGNETDVKIDICSSKNDPELRDQASTQWIDPAKNLKQQCSVDDGTSLEDIPASKILRIDEVFDITQHGAYTKFQKYVFEFDRSEPRYVKDDVFDSLMIDPGRKAIIKSLVNQHAKQPKHHGTIEGKGQGLIGLFAGGPGCSKTLTAEAVAEETKKSLCMASAGELGIDPEEFDVNLSRISDLSFRWDAVLLLDDADIFLHRQNDLDVFRNAMVSKSLRQLEDFQGIMILTPNRVEDCDPAFESRKHFSMFHPDLGYEARKLIWKSLLQKVTSAESCDSAPNKCSFTISGSLSPGCITQAQLLIDEPLLHMLAGCTLNDRQIQNTVRTSKTLAQEEGVSLEVGTAWRASRLELVQLRNTERTNSEKRIMKKTMIDVFLACWQSWLASFPGNFPDKIIPRP